MGTRSASDPRGSHLRVGELKAQGGLDARLVEARDLLELPVALDQGDERGHVVDLSSLPGPPDGLFHAPIPHDCLSHSVLRICILFGS